jgi:hypothetical protein
VRTLHIAAGDAGCTPGEVDVSPGQRLRIVVENEGASEYRIRDDDGRLEEIVVEPGEEASAFYFVPEGSGIYALRCHTREQETEVRLIAGVEGQPTAPPIIDGSGTPVSGAPDETVAVTLLDYSITPSKQSIVPGRVNFIATNISSQQAHQLNILQLLVDGSFRNIAGAGLVEPQQGGAVLVELQPGVYRLACLIRIGEAGSEIDHYQQGMWTDIEVTE